MTAEDWASEALTDRSRKAIGRAERTARRRGAVAVDTHHLLLALVEPDSGVAAEVLAEMGLQVPALLRAVDRIDPPVGLAQAGPPRDVGGPAEPAGASGPAGQSLLPPEERASNAAGWPSRGPGAHGRASAPGDADSSLAAPGALPLTRRADEALALAGQAAQRLGHNVVGTEHLILGLLEQERGAAGAVLKALGIRAADVRAALLRRILAAPPGRRTPGDDDPLRRRSRGPDGRFGT